MVKIYTDKQMMLSEYADILDCDINHPKYEYTVREIIEDSNEINGREIIKPYLDKIEAEIEEIATYDGLYIDRAYVLEIIDKYKRESEET